MPAHVIRTHLDDLAVTICERQFISRPDLIDRYGPEGRDRCCEDARLHLQYLATALEAKRPQIFFDYVAWTKIVLLRRDVREHDLYDNLRTLASVLTAFPNAGDAVAVVNDAVDALPGMPDDVPSMLDPRAPLWIVANEYLGELLRGRRGEAEALVTRQLESGASLRDIYRYIFEPVQQEVGRLWQVNQISVAQEHFCTAATQQIMARLYGRLFRGEQRQGRAVAMCVSGELHEIGLRIITDLLELEGWQTWYLGASVPPADAVRMCAEYKANVLLISATLPPHLAGIAEVIRIFRQRPELAASKIIVGGRAFRSAPDSWREMGADGYASNADECLALLERISA